MMITGCQYFGAEQTRGPYKVCGCTNLWPGKSYCDEHVWRVYQKDTAKGTSRKNKAIEREMADIKRLESIDHE